MSSQKESDGAVYARLPNDRKGLVRSGCPVRVLRRSLASLLSAGPNASACARAQAPGLCDAVEQAGGSGIWQRRRAESPQKPTGCDDHDRRIPRRSRAVIGDLWEEFARRAVREAGPAVFPLASRRCGGGRAGPSGLKLHPVCVPARFTPTKRCLRHGCAPLADPLRFSRCVHDTRAWQTSRSRHAWARLLRCHSHCLSHW